MFLNHNILQASALCFDLDKFSVGLETEIVDKGSNLSGGQRSRISFARVLYCGADVNLLDDPLSAVDSSVCEQMFQKGLKDLLKASKKTTLLVTHQVHLLSECDLVVLMNEDGSIKSCCQFQDIGQEDIKILLHDDLAGWDFCLQSTFSFLYWCML